MRGNILFLLFLLIFSTSSFSQEKKVPIVVNRQVEVIDYEYDYVYIELGSSFFASSFYPIISLNNPTERQQFFEKGRNIRPGFEFGYQQSVKAGRLAISAAIAYQRYTEYFSYNEYPTQEVTVQASDGTWQKILIAIGNPELRSRNNTLGYLKVPVGVSYFPKWFDEKIGITFQANYNYLIDANYMAKFSLVEPARPIGVGQFSPSFFSLTGKIAYHHRFLKNYELKAEPYFTVHLQDLISQQDLRFAMNTIGLQVSATIAY